MINTDMVMILSHVLQNTFTIILLQLLLVEVEGTEKVGFNQLCTEPGPSPSTKPIQIPTSSLKTIKKPSPVQINQHANPTGSEIRFQTFHTGSGRNGNSLQSLFQVRNKHENSEFLVIFDETRPKPVQLYGKRVEANFYAHNHENTIGKPEENNEHSNVMDDENGKHNNEIDVRLKRIVMTSATPLNDVKDEEEKEEGSNSVLGTRLEIPPKPGLSIDRPESVMYDLEYVTNPEMISPVTNLNSNAFTRQKIDVIERKLTRDSSEVPNDMKTDLGLTTLLPVISTATESITDPYVQTTIDSENGVDATEAMQSVSTTGVSISDLDESISVTTLGDFVSSTKSISSTIFQTWYTDLMETVPTTIRSFVTSVGTPNTTPKSLTTEEPEDYTNTSFDTSLTTQTATSISSTGESAGEEIGSTEVTDIPMTSIVPTTTTNDPTSTELSQGGYTPYSSPAYSITKPSEMPTSTNIINTTSSPTELSTTTISTPTTDYETEGHSWHLGTSTEEMSISTSTTTGPSPSPSSPASASISTLASETTTYISTNNTMMDSSSATSTSDTLSSISSSIPPIPETQTSIIITDSSNEPSSSTSYTDSTPDISATTVTSSDTEMSTEGEPNSTKNEGICDSNIWLQCDMNTSRCKCKDGMTYDSKRNLCLSLEGKDCESKSGENGGERLCITNAECTTKGIGQVGICKCKDGFLPSEKGNCLAGLDSPCSSINSNATFDDNNASMSVCYPGLKCSGNETEQTCSCEDGWTEGKPGSYQCFLDYNSKCSLDNKCNSFSFLNCSETSHECKCEDQTNQVYDEEGNSCVGISGENCMIKEDIDGRLLGCVKNATCKMQSERSSVGKCECDSGFENDWKGHCRLRGGGVSVIFPNSYFLQFISVTVVLIAFSSSV